MALPIFQRTVADQYGNVLPSAQVEVRIESSGALADLFSDRDGTIVLPNPFNADSNGLAQFYAAPDEYKITGSSALGSVIWRYVVIIDTNDIAIVATNAPNMQTVVDNIVDIQNAEENAIIASGAATSATDSATLAATYVPSKAIPSVTDFSLLTGITDGNVIFITDHNHGGEFVYDTSILKTAHNGGTIFDPDIDMTTWAFSSANAGFGVLRRLAIDFPKSSYFGIIPDGSSPSSAALQAMADLTESEGLSSCFIGCSKGTILVEDEVVFTDADIKIFGNMGATYHNSGKGGNLVASSAASPKPLFNLGGSKTTGSFGQWVIEDLSIRGGTLINAISFTSQTNAPDRGATLRNVSGRSLKSLVHIAPPEAGVTASLATLNIDSCNLSGNAYGIYSEGYCYGLNFTNNQAEQNSQAVIHGAFGGSVNISYNMMEGQNSPINILSALSGNTLQYRMTGNYFEGVGGSYLCKLATVTTPVYPAYAELGPNYFRSENFADYCLLSEGDFVAVVRDEYPIVLENESRIISGSEIFFRGVDYYQVKTSGVNGNEVQISTPADFIARGSSTYGILTATGVSSLITPFGIKADGYSVVGSTTDFTLPTETETTGDIIAISMLIRVNNLGTCTSTLKLKDNAGATIGTAVNPAVINTNVTGQRWHLVNFTVECTAGNSGPNTLLQISIDSGANPQIQIAGIAIKNYGPWVGVNKSIQPLCVY